MIVVFLLLIFQCVFSVKKQSNGIESQAYISQYTMMPWKGVFICWIFLSHLMGDWNYPLNDLDKAFNVVNDWFGQIVVVLLLFLSGYGVMYSLDKKESYLKTFLRKRVFITWLNFVLVVIIYLIVQSILGVTYQPIHLLKALIGLESVGNSNWYIFCILYLYVSTYVSFFLSTHILKIKKIQYCLGTLGVFVLVVLYIVIFRYILQAITVWYDSIFCYLLGMLFYFVSEKMYKFIVGTPVYPVLAIMLPIIYILNEVCRNVVEYNYLVYFNTKAILVIAWILVINAKYQIHNRWLYWCGENLFWIYILHRISFIILNAIGVTNLYLYLVVASVITVVLVVCIAPIINYLDRMIIKKE